MSYGTVSHAVKRAEGRGKDVKRKACSTALRYAASFFRPKRLASLWRQ